MTTAAGEPEAHNPPGSKRTRTAVLDGGRAAAVQQRRTESERCRQRVLDVLAQMRKSRAPLSDAEITRRASVNPQYLQRHRDLKVEAEAVRATSQVTCHAPPRRPTPAGKQRSKSFDLA
jgi:hypothetical protein